MTNFLKLSLLTLCGFASINAAQNAHSSNSTSQTPTLDFFRERAINKQRADMGSNLIHQYKMPHSNNRATLVLQGLSVLVAGYVGHNMVKYWESNNKHQEERLKLDQENQRQQAERLKLDQENQRLLIAQNDKSNGYTEQNTEIAKSNNTLGKMNTGMQSGAIMGCGTGMAVGGPPGAAIGSAAGGLIGLIVGWWKRL